MRILAWCCAWLLAAAPAAFAATSEGSGKRVTGGTSQGGASAASSRYRQQSNIGESTAGHRMSSSRFRLLPGILASTESDAVTAPLSDLDVTVLAAKTSAGGTPIEPETWQNDRTPFFWWKAPAADIEVAGYSYAVDGAPDDTIDTAGTSWDVASTAPGTLTDGPHVFSVKALNTAGVSGEAATFAIWVDTTPPAVTSYVPAAGALLAASDTIVTATTADVASGVAPASIDVRVNGAPASHRFDAATGVLTVPAEAFAEGANSVELRLADAVGNAPAPLIWSFTLDATPPAGGVVVNGGAESTTSLHVTLSLTAADAVSGVARMLISNDESGPYVNEAYATPRELWRLNAIRGVQRVWVTFSDAAGNVSEPVFDDITLWLLAPETVITGGPAGATVSASATFSFLCPEGGCVFSHAFDHDDWSAWSDQMTVERSGLTTGNHYFRVKAAKESNGTGGIQEDEEDPSPAERTWTVGVDTPVWPSLHGPPIKLWRID